MTVTALPPITWPTMELVQNPRRYQVTDPDTGEVTDISISVSKVASGNENNTGLVLWNVDHTIEYLKENPGDYRGARWHHQSKLKEAGNFGTLIHECIEDLMNRRHPRHKVLSEDSKRCVAAWFEWWKQQDFHSVVAVEQSVVCWLPFPYSGTFDALWLDNQGRLHLGDWKTSTRLHPKYAVQAGGYSLALAREHGLQVYQAHIIRLDRNLGTHEELLLEPHEIAAAAQLFEIELTKHIRYERLEKHLQKKAREQK